MSNANFADVNDRQMFYSVHGAGEPLHGRARLQRTGDRLRRGRPRFLGSGAHAFFHGEPENRREQASLVNRKPMMVVSRMVS